MAIFTKRQKLPLPGIAGRFGVESEESVRGLLVPIKEQAVYASQTDGAWRYWVRRDGEGQDGFGDSVGRLLPLPSQEFMARLNDHATGPVRPSFWKRPAGEAVVFDLIDEAVRERFALACAVGEALAGAEGVQFVRRGEPGGSSAELIQDALPNLNTNVAVWAADSATTALAFFPNGLLLRRARHQWVVPFAEVELRLERAGDAQSAREIFLALSDQRVRLRVNDPERAQRAAQALRSLIDFELRVRIHVDPKRNVDPKPRPRRTSSASCGRIVVEPKADDPARADRIVIRVEVERAAADPAEIVCNDSGLVFATESPMASDSDIAPLATDEVPDPVLHDEAPAPLRRPDVGRVRAAVGALLAYVAKASDGFSDAEARVIREALALPRGFDLERRYSAVRPESKGLAFALNIVRAQAPEARARVLRECEAVATADGSATPLETQRLAELRAALG